MFVRRTALAVLFGLLFAATLPTTTFAQDSDQLTVQDLARMHPHTSSFPGAVKVSGAAGLNGAATPNPGVDTLVSFDGHFKTFGYDPNGLPNQDWYYTMVGKSPEHEGTTTINAPVIPVSIDLRNFDGSPRYDTATGKRLYLDATQYVRPVLKSPVFSKSSFTSSNRPTQITDAVQRAEFWDELEDGWHTLLSPKVKHARVMVLIRGTYRFATYADGTLAYVLVDANTFQSKLFPPTFPVDNSTIIGAAELAGDMKTSDLTTLLFPDTYLYVGDPSQCCILGFHSYDFEPGVPSNGNRIRKYVFDYASWISPGIFGGGFQDVTALSHEVAEIFNDPFVGDDGVHGVTPWWLSPNGNCQDNLEVGDVIEGLLASVYPITMNGFTYHPQNEALLPWFEFKKHSSAIFNAYSYPDVTTLTALSPVEKAGCVP